uniref:Exocyst subunit Exo70 family protein n=1 Tax=Cajanus cajan TaxID=3821 RepID=A0A151U0X1_CAJCA|nr:Exocyst complex component 7 [Cajanus cajan]
MLSIEALQKENKSVISTITKHVGEYLKANVLDEDQTSVPKLHPDDNLLIDVLPRGIVKELHQSVKQMALDGFKKECLQVYTSCRREFLKDQGLEEGKLSSPIYMTKMTELLENSLEANSKNYNNPTLGYIFIMNNRRFIELEAKLCGLDPIFDNDWLQKNTTEFQKNLELYKRSSWNKILDFLKLDINESKPNVAAELMKQKLHWFNEHFDETCNVQSAWSVCDEELREQIIKSIENILLPVYGNFLGKFQELLGKHAYEYIKYGVFDVQDRVNNLFLVRQ